MRNSAGFTLIELMVTIIIISILAATVLLQWPGSTINLREQAEQLADDIRYTQSLAMTKGQRYRIVLSSASYQIINSSGSAVTLMNGSTTMTLNSGITIGALTNLPNSLINFDGRGTPYTDTASPGTALASTASIPMSANGETHTISVTPQTGRVVVQ